LLEVKPTYWLLMARENGTLEIYSLPDCNLCFLSKNVTGGPRVLVDNLEVIPIASSGTQSKIHNFNVTKT